MRSALLIGLVVAAIGLGAAPPQRTFMVYNDSDFALVQLQARTPHAKTWPFQLLGKYSLGVGRTAKATVVQAAGCTLDLLATFDDGHKQQKLGVETCKAKQITLSGK